MHWTFGSVSTSSSHTFVQGHDLHCRTPMQCSAARHWVVLRHSKRVRSGVEVSIRYNKVKASPVILREEHSLRVAGIIRRAFGLSTVAVRSQA
jgi:hypothetical protein